MSSVPPPPNARQLLATAGLAAKKSWGQNFLLDPSVLLAISKAALLSPGTVVVELGAGLGALTYYLAQSDRHIVAVERDRDLVPLLRQELAWAKHLEIVEADAARFDYQSLAARYAKPLSVTGNLPYQLSSRILVSLEDCVDLISQAVFLVQREVAQRLQAEPGGRDYGLLSVLVQRFFSVGRVVEVPPEAFFPPPKIHSTVVNLRRLPSPLSAADAALVAVAARAAFSSRRKTLRNSVASGLRADTGGVESALKAADISPQERAERLGVPEFLRLGQSLLNLGLIAERGLNAARAHE